MRRRWLSVSGWRTRARYRFDNLLARGTWAVLLWLGVVTLGAVLVSATLLAVFRVDFAGSQDKVWVEDFWQSLLRVIDAGTMAADVGWGPRVLALAITLFGILVAGTLIGLIANGVEQRVEELREGRSTVVESDHVVILGASTRLPIVIEQLALANADRRSQAIVVLADSEPVVLRERVRAAVDDLHGARVVFRRGDPARLDDLAMVALDEARAVIALADDARGDAGVVTSVLAAGAALGEFDRLPIVAELGDVAAADGLRRATGDGIHTLVGALAIGRITAYTLREPGLSQVVEELLSFRGCEVHVRPVGDLSGQPFGACVFRFANARPIGRVRTDGTVELNPGRGARLDRREQLVLIAHDRSVRPEPTAFADAPAVDGSALPRHDAPRPEHLLIVGWNALGARLLEALDDVAASGSSAVIIQDQGLTESTDPRVPTTRVIDVEVRSDSTAARELADRADVPFTSIVVLAQRTRADEADSRTLLTHMLLRRELDARRGAPNIVVELLDPKHVDLARMTGADDYVVSDAITARLVAQLAEQPLRRPVLLRLAAAEGPSLRLVTAEQLGLSRDVGFDEIVVTAYARGLLALGWRQGADVVLNPTVTRRVSLRADDQIVAVG